MKRPRYNLGLAGLGIELAAAVVGLTALGLWIDRRLETEPWATVIGASIGFVGGMYNFILSAQKAARRAEQQAAEQQAAEQRTGNDLEDAG